MVVLLFTPHFFYRPILDMMLFVVKLIHAIIRFFLVATPFIGTDYWLSLHLMVIPFVLLHWLTNQTVCFLTEMEKLLTRKDGDQTFFGQVFTPVYKNESFVGSILRPIYTVKDKDEEKRLVWFGMIILFFITFTRLCMTNFAFVKDSFTRLRSTLR